MVGHNGERRLQGGVFGSSSPATFDDKFRRSAGLNHSRAASPPTLAPSGSATVAPLQVMKSPTKVRLAKLGSSSFWWRRSKKEIKDLIMFCF
jgi:hypothetical protein